MHLIGVMQPLQGWSHGCCAPGAVPPAIEFVPFGDEIGRGLSFDTASKEYDKRESTRAFSLMGLLSYFQNSIICNSMLEGLDQEDL